MTMPDVWHCPEHGCELVRETPGWFCPDGQHTASDAALAVWEDVYDVAAELADVCDYLWNRAS
jgi:hypothetical protein